MNYYKDRGSRLILLSRNEGKIKSHESCLDVRAWSHDCGTRDRYLREWIKCDMPISILPFGTLASFLKIITCRRRGKVTPHCHPDCKSRILLESICLSCDAIRECLKQNKNFEKYFEEEEFETAHWPCEKCLSVLKTIKMFWKIILDNFFKIKIPCHEFKRENYCKSNCIRSIAKSWQNDILQQTKYVKDAPSSNFDIMGLKETNHNLLGLREIESSKTNNSKMTALNGNELKCSICASRKPSKRLYKKNKGTCFKLNTVDIGCDNQYTEIENEEILAYKNNIKYLQKQHIEQLEEIKKLKSENISLRIELKNVYNVTEKCCCDSEEFIKVTSDTLIVPKPYEMYVEENYSNGSLNNIDSEMIITMKNCKDEQKFRHVSVLQVLHKTNGPRLINTKSHECCFRNENPLDLLNKVQKTFGDIVKREMCIAIERSRFGNKSGINATFRKVISSKSDPSCSILSLVGSAASMVVSAKE